MTQQLKQENEFFLTYPYLSFIRFRLAAAIESRQNLGLTRNIVIFLGILFYIEASLVRDGFHLKMKTGLPPIGSTQFEGKKENLLKAFKKYQEQTEALSEIPLEKTQKKKTVLTFFDKAQNLNNTCVEILNLKEDVFLEHVTPSFKKFSEWKNIYSQSDPTKTLLLKAHDLNLNLFTLYRDIAFAFSESKPITKQQIERFHEFFPQIFDCVYCPNTLYKRLTDKGFLDPEKFLKKMGYSQQGIKPLIEKEQELDSIFQKSQGRAKQYSDFLNSFNGHLLEKNQKRISLKCNPIEHSFFLTLYLSPVFLRRDFTLWNPPINTLVFSPWSLMNVPCGLPIVATNFIQSFRSLLYQLYFGITRTRADILTDFLNADQNTLLTPEKLLGLKRSLIGYVLLDFKRYRIKPVKDSNRFVLEISDQVDTQLETFLQHFLESPYSANQNKPSDFVAVIVPEFRGVINCASAYEIDCFESRLDTICPMKNQYKIQRLPNLTKNSNQSQQQVFVKEWYKIIDKIFPKTRRDPLWVRLPGKKGFEDLELSLPLLESTSHSHSGSRFFSLHSNADIKPFLKDFQLYYLIGLKYFVVRFLATQPKSLDIPLQRDLRVFLKSLDVLINENISPKKRKS